MMKKLKTLIFIFLLIHGQNSPAQSDYDEKLLNQFHKITSEEMTEWLEKLCSPEFNGRLTGTKEYLAGAEWVASKFREWGIKPAGDRGSYFQWFDWPYTEILDHGSLTLRIPQADGTAIMKNYSYPDQYFPGMNSGSGEATSEVVFAGFGITAPELGYDDYKGIDVRGKIVLVNRDVPPTDAFNPEYKKWVAYCYHQYKLKNAVTHGAAGFIYAEGNLANPNISYDKSVIVCGVGEEPVNDIFSGTGTTNAVMLDSIRKTMKPASFSTGKIMTIRENTKRHEDGRGCNVIGLIEGSDPELKNEVIIIGGHLDAVGYSGQVVNGALDNGSGVVDIMAAAQAMALSGIRLKRSVMFLLFGGEETGLIGSKLYVGKPVFPKEKTVTFINLDMVGNGTGLSVNASGPYKNLLSYFEDANSRYIHRPFTGSAPEPKDYYGRPRSDEYNFSSRGYRTMSVGTTGWYKKVFYHVPGDDPGAVTIDIMQDVARMLFVGLTNMANDESLTFR